MDRDGFISNGELYLVLKQMVGNNLKVSQLSSPGTIAKLELTCRTSNYSRLSTRQSWRQTRMGKLLIPVCLEPGAEYQGWEIEFPRVRSNG